MPPRAAFVDYVENNRWAGAAQQACVLHDHLMDGIRIFYDFDLDDGCRSIALPIGPNVTKLSQRYKGKGKEFPLKLFIENSIDTEGKREDTLIDRKILDKMKEVFCAFVANDQLEVAQTEQYGETQLMFICFPIPKAKETPLKYQNKFNEEYTFVNPKGRGFIQLGPACLLNHHCDATIRNVNQEGGLQDRRYLASAWLLKPTLTKSINAEQELFIDYGSNWFGPNNRKCLCSMGHPRITLFSSSSWSSVGQSSDSIIQNSAMPDTPRSSRAKRRLTIGEADRPRIAPSIATTRQPRKTTSRPKHGIPEVPGLVSLFSSDDDDDEVEPVQKKQQRGRGSSNPPESSRTLNRERVKKLLSTEDIKAKRKSLGPPESGSSKIVNANGSKVSDQDRKRLAGPATIKELASTAKLGPAPRSLTQPGKPRPVSGGQTSRSTIIHDSSRHVVSKTVTTAKRVQGSAPSPLLALSASSIPSATRGNIGSVSAPVQPISVIQHVPDIVPPPLPVEPSPQIKKKTVTTARPETPPLPPPTPDRDGSVTRQRESPPTTPAQRALVDYLLVAVPALHAEIEADAKYQDSHQEPEADTPPVTYNMPEHERAYTPGLFGSDESSDDESLYRPTPQAPDRDNFTRSSEEIDYDAFDGTESEIEYFELYGEPRPKFEGLDDQKGEYMIREDEVEGNIGSDPMDICSDDEESGAKKHEGTNGISAAQHWLATRA